jgi:lysozyme
MPIADGIDVSHYQNDAGAINWSKVKASGVRYVFIKISDKLSIDAYAASNVAGARSAGLMVGGYHFLRNTASGVAQATAFLAHAPLNPGDLLPVLDLEVIPSTPAAKAAYVDRAREWMAVVSGRVGGRKPFLYTRANILSAVGNPKDLARHPLWLARYGSSPPPIPVGASDYAVWQYSESGSVNGITGPVDLNVTRTGFAAFQAKYGL